MVWSQKTSSILWQYIFDPKYGWKATVESGPEIILGGMGVLPTLDYEHVILDDRFSERRTRKKGVSLEQGGISTKTRFSRNIWLSNPLVSSPMDTVTESAMAIVMAQEGGAGVIHRFMSEDREVEELIRVKRAESYVIHDPYTLLPEATVDDAKSLMEKTGVGGIIIVNAENIIMGIVTKRDLLFEDRPSRPVTEIMTKKVITAEEGISREAALKLLKQHKIEKLPLVDQAGHCRGLITLKDIEKAHKYPDASRDAYGRLVGLVAVGLRREGKEDYLRRAEKLIKAGADAIVIDVAKGGNTLGVEALIRLREVVKAAKRELPVDIVAGNVANEECALSLLDAGADGLRVNIGPGSACDTRKKRGIGRGAVDSVMEVASVARRYDVPVISDGGVREEGDIAKALACGASCVMIGGFFSGTAETPGPLQPDEHGALWKLYRGMASTEATLIAKRLTGEEIYDEDLLRTSPEGRPLLVPFRGSVRPIIERALSSLRSSMSYLGVKTIEEMPSRARFRLDPKAFRIKRE